MTKYYKVVQRSLVSCVAGGNAEVQYKINEYVEAPNWLSRGHRALFVFATFRDAFDFANRMAVFTSIYECKIQYAFKHLPYFLDTDLLARHIVYPSHVNFPLGTVAVRKVKLIKKIKEDKK